MCLVLGLCSMTGTSLLVLWNLSTAWLASEDRSRPVILSESILSIWVWLRLTVSWTIPEGLL